MELYETHNGLTVGDTVEKCMDPYKIQGVLLSIFRTIDGLFQYVVEHAPSAPGVISIYNRNQIRKPSGVKTLQEMNVEELNLEIEKLYTLINESPCDMYYPTRLQEALSHRAKKITMIG